MSSFKYLVENLFVLFIIIMTLVGACVWCGILAVRHFRNPDLIDHTATNANSNNNPEEPSAVANKHQIE